MLKTDMLTVEIQDKASESAINVELTKETMYKLYRIKEIYNYDSFFEFDAYTKYCDEIKESTKNFVNAIYQEYLKAYDELEQSKLNDDTEYVIKEMDKLINAGYDFNTAFDRINKKYLK